MNRLEKSCRLLVLLMLVTGSVISLGCISEPVQILSAYLSPSSTTLLQDGKVYDPDPSRLTVPMIPAQAPFRYEGKPAAGEMRFSPGYQLASSYHYTAFYEGSDGVTCIYVENMGDYTIFAYEFGLLDVSTGNWYGRETGTTIIPGENKKLGNVAVHVPAGSEDIRLKLGMSILVKTQSGQWYDYGRQYFEEFTIDAEQQPLMESPEYLSNPQSSFYLINDKVDPYNTEVRKMAAISAKKYPGPYSVYQLCSLFDDTKNRIDYINDPRGRDMWSPPGDTLLVGAGDCDDYAILLASLVESIGGTARIYLTDTHAFAAVYIGDEDNTQLVVEGVRQYYGDLPVYYTTDEYGSWLLMDPTSSVYAGGLPAGAAPVNEGWTFQNTSQVIAIDIAPKDQE